MQYLCFLQKYNTYIIYRVPSSINNDNNDNTNTSLLCINQQIHDLISFYYVLDEFVMWIFACDSKVLKLWDTGKSHCCTCSELNTNLIYSPIDVCCRE